MLSIVQAQINNNALSSNLIGLEGTEFLGSLIKGLIGASMVIAGVYFVFMVIWGGIKYVSSEGDKTQAETARKTITNALIGIVIVFSLYAIVNVVSCFFGLSFLEFEVGELNVSFGACSGTAAENPGPRDGGPM